MIKCHAPVPHMHKTHEHGGGPLWWGALGRRKSGPMLHCGKAAAGPKIEEGLGGVIIYPT